MRRQTVITLSTFWSTWSAMWCTSSTNHHLSRWRAAASPLILRGDLYACVKRQRCVCGWRRRRRRRRIGHRWCWCESFRSLLENVTGLNDGEPRPHPLIRSLHRVYRRGHCCHWCVFWVVRATGGFDEQTTVSSRHSSGLSCSWHRHRWIAAGMKGAENRT